MNRSKELPKFLRVNLTSWPEKFADVTTVQHFIRSIKPLISLALRIFTGQEVERRGLLHAQLGAYA
jgi:hypothetical protein